MVSFGLEETKDAEQKTSQANHNVASVQGFE